MLVLSPVERAQVVGILGRLLPGVEVRAYGSRARGEARRFSDLDLALMSPEPLGPRLRAELREAFSVSELPFRVDLLDWASASEEFRLSIEAELVELR
jgi:predicted nucleotidyltransferase